MSTADDTRLRQVGDRVEALVSELTTHSDPRTRTGVEELVRVLVDLYGSGLARIMAILDETAVGSDELFAHLLDDELVASLLVLHDLHPLSLPARVERALARAGEAAGKGSDDVRAELVAVDGVRARVRVTAPGFGCGSAGGALRAAVEEELGRSVPEVDLEVEAALALRPPAPVAVALRSRPSVPGA
ncbi:MAG: hypothetical protein ACRD0J_15775 [Acidimicrobiales bacterium]